MLNAYGRLDRAMPPPAPCLQPLRAPAWRWLPKRVVFTPAALEHEHGGAIRDRVEALGLDAERLPANRLSGLRGADDRETYRIAKSTLAVVAAPPGKLRLQPIPPSADWQFHLAEGCPGHCQYCYLAGSLSGPPVVRAYANLPEILAATRAYDGTGEHPQTFEVSCYTDPLGLEHLTGSLAACVVDFGQREDARLRTVTKYDTVEGLVGLAHK
jgi:spore photoproduct lyase